MLRTSPRKDRGIPTWWIYISLSGELFGGTLGCYSGCGRECNECAPRLIVVLYPFPMWGGVQNVVTWNARRLDVKRRRTKTVSSSIESFLEILLLSRVDLECYALM